MQRRRAGGRLGRVFVLGFIGIYRVFLSGFDLRYYPRVQPVLSAQQIRESFFRPGSQLPELHFTLTPVSLDAASTRFVLEVDGQGTARGEGDALLDRRVICSCR